MIRALGGFLIVGAILWLVFELNSPGLLPSFGMDPLVLSASGLVVGIVVVWLDEKARERRRWKPVRRR